MDELEFRRRLLANPHDSDPDILAAKIASPKHLNLAAELEELDALIDQTLRVDVPDTLVDKILFQQNSGLYRTTRKTKLNFAMAACMAFFCGLMLGIFKDQLHFSDPDSSKLTKIAIEHYYSENAFTENINENATLQQINLKLAPLNHQLTEELPGEVTYINYCGFNNQRALHIVLKEHSGSIVNIFLVPESSISPEDYTDGSMKAISLPSENKNTLILVGEKNLNLSPLAEQLRKSLNQKI